MNMKTLFQVLVASLQENSRRFSTTDYELIQMPPISFYSFGSPRVGNRAFSRFMEDHVHTIYRIKVNGDIVTMVPKVLGFYHHTGTLVLVDETEKGNLIIRPTIIEESFFNRTIGNLSNHSLEKYRICLESCFGTEEFHKYVTKEYHTGY
jgi:hypothetical protein